MDSEKLTEESCSRYLEGMDGVIVPGGFGGRGIQGMTHAAHYARVNRIPYFGICLGMQVAVIEYARNVLAWSDANSSEFDPECTHPVIDLMPDQQGNLPKGGTMRLGATPVRSSLAPCWKEPIKGALSEKGTGTATSSTTATGSSWRKRDWLFPAPRPTAGW